jgi:hypothetical protein
MVETEQINKSTNHRSQEPQNMMIRRQKLSSPKSCPVQNVRHLSAASLHEQFWNNNDVGCSIAPVALTDCFIALTSFPWLFQASHGSPWLFHSPSGSHWLLRISPCGAFLVKTVSFWTGNQENSVFLSGKSKNPVQNSSEIWLRFWRSDLQNESICSTQHKKGLVRVDTNMSMNLILLLDTKFTKWLK